MDFSDSRSLRKVVDKLALLVITDQLGLQTYLGN